MNHRYRFVFTKRLGFSKTTYEYFIDTSRSKEEMFHDACCLLDFSIFDEVRMFDEHGDELIELY